MKLTKVEIQRQRSNMIEMHDKLHMPAQRCTPCPACGYNIVKRYTPLHKQADRMEFWINALDILEAFMGRSDEIERKDIW